MIRHKWFIDKSGLTFCLYCTKSNWRSCIGVFLWRWCKICTILRPMGGQGWYLKKCPKPCWPIRGKETWAKYTPTTLLRQRKLALSTRNTLFAVLVAKKLINGPVPYSGLEPTIHVIKSQIHLVRQSLSVKLRTQKNRTWWSGLVDERLPALPTRLHADS